MTLDDAQAVALGVVVGFPQQLHLFSACSLRSEYLSGVARHDHEKGERYSRWQMEVACRHR